MGINVKNQLDAMEELESFIVRRRFKDGRISCGQEHGLFSWLNGKNNYPNLNHQIKHSVEHDNSDTC